MTLGLGCFSGQKATKWQVRRFEGNNENKLIWRRSQSKACPSKKPDRPYKKTCGVIWRSLLSVTFKVS